MLRIFTRLLLLLSLAAPLFGQCAVPVMSAESATPDSTGTQVTFAWTTNIAATTGIAYGVGYPGIVLADTDVAGVTSHSITVTGLLPSTTYGYQFRSRAVSGGSPCAYPNWGFYNGASGLTVNTNAPPAGTFDYYINWIGPLHVTQGYGVYEQLQVGTLVGSTGTNTVKVIITGLPNFVSLRWSDQQLFGEAGTVSTTTITNDTLKWFTFQPDELYILTNQGGTTTPGTYTVTATAQAVTSGPPTHVATFSLTVDSVPFGTAFPSGAPAYYPAIPDLTTYVSTASTYGAFNCAQDLDASPRTIRPNDNSNLTPVGPSIQKGSWYYDGVRVYQNVTNLLNDSPTWQQCIDNVNAVYRDGYVIPNNGSVQVFTMFPQGIYNDYLLHGTAADLTAINDLDLHTYQPAHGTLVSPGVIQRETAYSLKDDIFAQALGQNNVRLGQSTSFYTAFHMEHVLGQIDQVCYSQNPSNWETFMVGLQADALIDYYTLISADPRIPPAIKCAADYLYAHAWNTVSDDQGAFQYDPVTAIWNEGPSVGASSMVALDLLIAPMYAWIFSKTGLTAYQTEGDIIWDYGVLYEGAANQAGGLPANLGSGNGPPNGNSGKQFSQQYYWGSNYATWRSNPSPPAGAPMFAKLGAKP